MALQEIGDLWSNDTHMDLFEGEDYFIFYDIDCIFHNILTPISDIGLSNMRNIRVLNLN